MRTLNSLFCLKFIYYDVFLDYGTLLIEETEGSEHVKKIILFDGECNFCDKSVQFIIKRDPEAIFSFTSQQGEAGQQMIKKHHAPSSVDSIILIENDTYYLKSSAALRICRHLQGAWKLLFIFILVPYPIRDFFIIFWQRIATNGLEKRSMYPANTRSAQKIFIEIKKVGLCAK